MSKLPSSLPAKAIAKVAVIVAGIFTLVAGTAIALNWTLLRRVITYPEDFITNVDWYEPLATVKGQPASLSKANSSLIPQTSLDQISAYAQAQNSSALLVMHRGQLVLENYWGDFTPTSTSNSMSLSKTIIALLIGVAIEEGQIKSELEPVANYIPEWSKDARKNITLRDLLYMQSGLQNRDDTDSLRSDLVQMYASADADAVALKIPAVQAPGKAYDYNNANTQILSEVLERATGERYADYLSTRLWQTLQADDAAIWLDRPQGNPKPFCCLFAIPRDWARVGQLFLDLGQVNGKQVVATTWLKKMMQPSSLEPNYGYHLWLKARNQAKPGLDRAASVPFLASDTIYLDGKSHQRVYIIPSSELVIVRIGEQAEQWDDSYIPNTLVSSLSNLYQAKNKDN